MEVKMLRILLFQLKIVIVGCVGIMIFFLLSAFMPGDESEEPWKEVGISKERADDFITESFMRGYFYSIGTINPKNIASGNKSAVAKDVLVYCKRHVRTETFRQEYSDFRKKIRPVAPSIKTKEQIRKELLSDYEEAVKDNQRLLNMALEMQNKEMKKTAEKSLAKSRKILEEVNTGNSRLFTDQLIYADMRYQSELESYEAHICEWEKNYPADTKQLIKRRLEHFIDITKDIDFNAGIKEVNGKKIFINPSYEQKPVEWKMGYRAGKEVVQTARTFAGQWMKEL
jgi:hypothetical protein